MKFCCFALCDLCVWSKNGPSGQACNPSYLSFPSVFKTRYIFILFRSFARLSLSFLPLFVLPARIRGGGRVTYTPQSTKQQKALCCSLTKALCCSLTSRARRMKRGTNYDFSFLLVPEMCFNFFLFLFVSFPASNPHCLLKKMACVYFVFFAVD